MGLTLKDVQEKRFTAVKLRYGYDMTEVDTFLEEVEAEFKRLLEENDQLRKQVASGGGTPVKVEAKDEPTDEAKVEAKPEPVKSKGGSIGEASAAAARLLEIASANADELMESAQAEADQVKAAAQAEADQLKSKAQSDAEAVEAEARLRAQKLDEETEERRKSLISDIERERNSLQAEVDHLRAYEREYRARLKAYFSSQLEQLETGASVEPTTAERLEVGSEN